MVAAPPTLTVWEKVASTRWGTYVTEVEKRAVMKAHSLVPRPTQALEIGCEGGRWSKMLTDVGWRMTCIDVDREALEACRAKVPQAACILADRGDRTIPCDSSSVALLLCIEVAPVIQSDWFLPEAFRALNSGGIFVGVFWNRLSWRGLQARVRFRMNPGVNADFYSRSYPACRRTILGTGFRLVYEEGFCWSPFGRSSNSPLIPVFVQMERMLGLRRFTAISPWIAVIAQKPAATNKQ